MNVKDKFKKYFNQIKEKIVSVYISQDKANYVAIGTTIGAVILFAVISIAIISSIAGSDKCGTSHTETSLSDMVVAEATSEPETTPTTEVATQQESQTATEPETTSADTQSQTIALADLDIGNAEDSTEKYVDKGALENEFKNKPVAVTKPTTATPIQQQTPSSSSINKNVRIVKGIDISKWNSNPSIDWSKVKASGVEFVIIRAGYRSQTGTSMYADSRFKEHIEGALAANLQVGVYFYSQATTEREALEEASYLLSLIKGYNITYPVCFDWEPVSGSRAAKARLSKGQATAIAKKFLSTIEAYGYEAMLYSYHSAIADYFDMTQLSAYKTWVAWYYDEYKNNGRQYQAGELPPLENYPYQMWQYSSTGTVPGIKGNVDLNVAFFTYSENGATNSTIEFELPTNSYTTNKGTAVDYTTGVKAFDSAGFDMSSFVTTSIIDANGNVLPKNEAFNKSGFYTITYTLKDFTGLSKKVTAKLTVLANLTIQLTKKELTFNIRSATYDDIINSVTNNLVKVFDDEGKSYDLSAVTITGLDGFYYQNVSSGAPEDQTSETDSSMISSENNTDNSTENEQEDNSDNLPDTSTADNLDNETDTSTVANSDNETDTSTVANSDNETDTSTEKVSNNGTILTTSADNSTENTSSVDKYTLIPGTYSITYAISDSMGATAIETVILNIVDEEQTTTK